MSNDLKAIKKQIYKEDKIEEFLEKLGCEFITPKHNRYEARLPFKFPNNNKRAVQIVISETLTSYIRNKNFSGDIFGLVSFIRHGKETERDIMDDLPNAKEWVVNEFGYHSLVKDVKKKGNNAEKHLGWLKTIKNRRKQSGVVDLSDVTPNPILDESYIKSQYLMTWHDSWRQEGISPKTQMKFEVGFDLESKRIVVMMRNRDGKLIGVKGRTTLPDWEERDIPKYLFLYKYNKSIEWFNLHRALPFIKERQQILIFEGYKGCMFADQFGYENSISIEGDKITEVQVQIIKNLGMNIEIVLCLDKDKYTAIDEETGEILNDSSEIKEYAKLFKGRRVTAILDTKGDLQLKDSPTDKGYDVWRNLFNNRFTIQKP